MSKNTYTLAAKPQKAAMERYHAGYDNRLYSKAIEGKSVSYANALTNEALALCGSPYYNVTRRRWSQAALDFLKEFVK